MLKIRFQRVGRRNDPHFRLIVTDSRRGPRSGKYVEALGFYGAKLGKSDLKFDRIKYWLERGAQISPTARHLLSRSQPSAAA